jgi:hypothetical protein
MLLALLLLATTAAMAAPAPFPNARRAPAEQVWQIDLGPLSAAPPASRGTLQIVVRHEDAELSLHFVIEDRRAIDAFAVLRLPHERPWFIELKAAAGRPPAEAVVRAVRALGDDALTARATGGGVVVAVRALRGAPVGQVSVESDGGLEGASVPVARFGPWRGSWSAD